MKLTKLSFIVLFFFAIFPILTIASPTTTVQQAFTEWCDDLGTAKGDPTAIVKLYAPEAILLATLSPILYNKKGELTGYFKKLTSFQNIKCTKELLVTQLEGDIAVNSGLYDFSYRDSQGKDIHLPARFTFVYKKEDQRWLIINHHSSLLPESPV